MSLEHIVQYMPPQAVEVVVSDRVSTADGVLYPSTSIYIDQWSAVYKAFSDSNFNPTLVAGRSNVTEAVELALLFDSCNPDEALTMAITLGQTKSVSAILSGTGALPTLDHLLVAVETDLETLALLLEDSRIDSNNIDEALQYSVQLNDLDAVKTILSSDRVSTEGVSTGILKAAELNVDVGFVVALLECLYVRDYSLAETLSYASGGKNNTYNTVLSLLYDRFDEMEFE